MTNAVHACVFILFVHQLRKSTNKQNWLNLFFVQRLQDRNKSIEAQGVLPAGCSKMLKLDNLRD